MAVSRVTSRTWNRKAAKKTVRYITHAHRREEEEQGSQRELFDRDGKKLTKDQVYRWIDNAPGDTAFFRFALSPDRKKEDCGKDLDFKELTEMVMMQLQSIFPKHTIRYAAAIHTNTDNRHAHILALLPVKRIPVKELTRLIEFATQEALRQRAELDKNLGRTSPFLDIAQNRAMGTATPGKTKKMHQDPSIIFERIDPSQLKGDEAHLSKSRRQTSQNRLALSRKTGEMTYETPDKYADPKARTCPNCGPTHQMERYGRRYECPSCGLRMKFEGLGVEIVNPPGLELDLEGWGRHRSIPGHH
jgi:ribosomal protein S27AE